MFAILYENTYCIKLTVVITSVSYPTELVTSKVFFCLNNYRENKLNTNSLFDLIIHQNYWMHSYLDKYIAAFRRWFHNQSVNDFDKFIQNN